jgi:DNA-binding LacI/PurR family transcriptional regulator
LGKSVFQHANARQSLDVPTTPPPAVRTAARKIPRDVSIVTMENVPLMKYLTPPHTVVSQPMEQLSEEMVKLCDRTKEASKELVDVTLPCSLIERSSVLDLRNDTASSDS